MQYLKYFIKESDFLWGETYSSPKNSFGLEKKDTFLEIVDFFSEKRTSFFNFHFNFHRYIILFYKKEYFFENKKFPPKNENRKLSIRKVFFQ